MVRTREREDLYRIAETFVNAALRGDDSLFTPGIPIWSLATLEDLDKRFVEPPEGVDSSFEATVRHQLARAPQHTAQLMGEILYVHLLFPSRIGGGRKRQLLNTVMSVTPENPPIPADLNIVLDTGIAGGGAAYNTGRPAQIRFLIDFALAWKRLPPAVVHTALSDPWQFKEIVWQIPLRGAQNQREVLLHLVYPDIFESIVTRAAKEKIAKHFSALLSEPTDDLDRQLLQIRRKLGDKHGPTFSFYDPGIKELWQTDSGKWGQFIRWAKRFYEFDDFDAQERDYKLEIAAKLQEIREALLQGQSWLPSLRNAFAPPNNLVSWRTSGSFMKWCEAAPNEAAAALKAIWGSEGTAASRIRAFLERLPDEAVHGPGSRLTLASFFLMAIDPTNFPIYRETPIRRGCDLTGFGRPPQDADEAQVYEHALAFFDKISEEASARGLELRDRLDAQGVLWSVVSAKKYIDAQLPPAERAALLRYLDEPPIDPDPDPKPDQVTTTRTLNQLADSLLLAVRGESQLATEKATDSVQ